MIDTMFFKQRHRRQNLLKGLKTNRRLNTRVQLNELQGNQANVSEIVIDVKSINNNFEIA